MYLLKFLGVMIGMILADICWTYYFIKVSDRKSVQAGIWASLIYVFSIFITHSYVNDISLGIAAVLGSFIGTYIAIELKKRKEK